MSNMRFVVNAPWPKDEVEKLVAWHAAGIGNLEMAQRLGRTVTAVKAKVRALKLPARHVVPTPPVRQRVRAPENPVQRAGKTTLPPLPSLSNA